MIPTVLNIWDKPIISKTGRKARLCLVILRADLASGGVLATWRPAKNKFPPIHFVFQRKGVLSIQSRITRASLGN